MQYDKWTTKGNGKGILTAEYRMTYCGVNVRKCVGIFVREDLMVKKGGTADSHIVICPFIL